MAFLLEAWIPASSVAPGLVSCQQTWTTRRYERVLSDKRCRYRARSSSVTSSGATNW